MGFVRGSSDVKKDSHPENVNKLNQSGQISNTSTVALPLTLEKLMRKQ